MRVPRQGRYEKPSTEADDQVMKDLEEGEEIEPVEETLPDNDVGSAPTTKPAKDQDVKGAEKLR
jgi:hypothetical protein